MYQGQEFPNLDNTGVEEEELQSADAPDSEPAPIGAATEAAIVMAAEPAGAAVVVGHGGGDVHDEGAPG